MALNTFALAWVMVSCLKPPEHQEDGTWDWLEVDHMPIFEGVEHGINPLQMCGLEAGKM